MLVILSVCLVGPGLQGLSLNEKYMLIFFFFAPLRLPR